MVFYLDVNRDQYPSQLKQYTYFTALLVLYTEKTKNNPQYLLLRRLRYFVSNENNLTMHITPLLLGGDRGKTTKC